MESLVCLLCNFSMINCISFVDMVDCAETDDDDVLFVFFAPENNGERGNY